MSFPEWFLPIERFLWSREGFSRFLAIARKVSDFSTVETSASVGSCDAEVDVFKVLIFVFVVWFLIVFFVYVAIVNFDVSDTLSGRFLFGSSVEKLSWSGTRFVPVSTIDWLDAFEAIELSFLRVHFLRCIHPFS